jgi:FKBP-type peptidyl-prolyl cis-trans isomerase
MKTTTSIAVLVLSAAFAGGCSQQPEPKVATVATADADKQKDFKTLEDRFSYAYGADLAEKFKDEGTELNVALMAEAMKTVFEGGERKMSDDEVIATLEIYREVFLKEREAKLAAASEKNRKEGEEFLQANAKKEGVVITKSGLQYKVINTGKAGRKPTVEDEVKVQYQARFIDGTEFDSTYKRNKPYSANAKMLIDGWAEALLLMTEGAKWELYIPSNLAYGEQGSPPYVGPNAVLIFEVELVEIEKLK